jgi:hypothetical protein
MIEIPGILDKICGEIRTQLTEQDENYNLIVTGIPGRGKSGTALELARRIDPTFTEEKVVFTPDDFIDHLDSPLATPGSVIIFDEAGCGRSAYESQQKMQIAMNKVLQSHRYLNLCVIYTASFMSFIIKNDRKLAHANFKVFKKEQNPTRRVIGKWYDLKWSENLQKNLTIFKRYHVNQAPLIIAELAVPHPPMDLWNKYRKREKPFKESVRSDYKTQRELQKDPQLLNRQHREEAMIQVKKYADKARKNIERYKGKRGAFNSKKLAVGLNIGTKMAEKVKAALELEAI